MPEKPMRPEDQPEGSARPPRPAPPPFRPNKELIGYIERGQKPQMQDPKTRKPPTRRQSRRERR